MMKIGILGGTFDPLHKGHIALGKAAMELFKLDKVYFVPAADPYHKETPLAEKEDRYRMVELALEGEAGMFPSDVDLLRDGPTYAIDTVDALLTRERASYYYIMGSDAYLNILGWKDIEELASVVTFLVALRSNEGDIAWKSFVDSMPGYLREKTLLFPFKPHKVSSEMIRRKGPLKKYLPDPVYEYIKEKGLYRNE